MEDQTFAADADTLRPEPRTDSGLDYGRRRNGDVVIESRLLTRGADGEVGIDQGRRMRLVIPQHEWIGIVAACSAEGASAEAVRAASMVHASHARIDVQLAGETIARVVLSMADSVILPDKPTIIPAKLAPA